MSLTLHLLWQAVPQVAQLLQQPVELSGGVPPEVRAALAADPNAVAARGEAQLPGASSPLKSASWACARARSFSYTP